MPALRRHPLGAAACGALGVSNFVAVALLRLPLVWVLLGVGGLACVLTWRRIA
jgi:chromate transporter